MVLMTDNEEIKAKMREALTKKQHGQEVGVDEAGHQKGKGPASRGRQGGSREFRRKTGG